MHDAIYRGWARDHTKQRPRFVLKDVYAMYNGVYENDFGSIAGSNENEY